MITLLFLLKIIAVTPPYQPPTWENLIPWIIGFFATLSSGIIYYILNQQNKKLDAIQNEVGRMSDAIYLAQRVKLLEMAANPNYHPAIKEQCNLMTREADQAARK